MQFDYSLNSPYCILNSPSICFFHQPRNGKGILAFPSRTNKGVARIVPHLKEAAGVVTTRWDDKREMLAIFGCSGPKFYQLDLYLLFSVPGKYFRNVFYKPLDSLDLRVLSFNKQDFVELRQGFCFHC